MALRVACRVLARLVVCVRNLTDDLCTRGLRALVVRVDVVDRDVDPLRQWVFRITLPQHDDSRTE